MIKQNRFPTCFAALLFLSLISITSTPLATTVYVDADAPGANSGASWYDAFTTLQPGIDLAGPDDEVWVAEGTYYPSLEVGGTGERYRSFQLKDEVAVYGGFISGETDLSERDWENNSCILSGDIGVESDKTDNCYHVFYHPDDFNLTNSSRLDGFTITGGYANDPGGDKRRGAGMFNRDSEPTITNCIFTANESTGSSYARGGAMCNYYCAPIITKCTFTSNIAYAQGGAIFNAGMSSNPSMSLISDCIFENNSTGEGGVGDGGAIYNSTYCRPIIVRCTFSNNYARYNGGAIVNSGDGSGIYAVNCTFSDNTAGMYGGVIYNFNSTVGFYINCTFVRSEVTASNGHGGVIYNLNSSPGLSNCVLYDNASGCVGQGIYNIQFSDPVITNCVLDDIWVIHDGSECEAVVTYCVMEQEGYEDPGLHNIYLDPIFTDPGNDDFTVMGDSPCIDAGNNDALPADFGDLDDDGDTAEEIPFDIVGNARRFDDPETADGGYGVAPIVDIGIYEFGGGGQAVDYDYDYGIDRFASGNYPNPFSPGTTIRFTLPSADDVQLGIYSVNGRLVRTIVNTPHSASEFEYEWNGRDADNRAVSAGVYFYRLQVGDETVTRPIVLQR